MGSSIKMNAGTHKTIEQLVSGNIAVKPLRSPLTRAVIWLLASFVVVGSEVSLVHMHGLPFNIQVSAPWVSSTAVVILCITLAALAAFRATVPGTDDRKIPALVLLVLAPLWLAVELVAFNFEPGTSPFSAHLGGGEVCALMISGFSSVPTLLAYVMLRRGAPIHPARAGALALLAGAACGALGMQLLCPMQEAAHLVVWHILPTLGLGTLGFILGRIFLKW